MQKLLLLMCALASFFTTAAELSFAFVPQQSAAKLARNWQPIIDYINAHTGDHYVFKTAKDIPTFESRVLAGEYDIAYMNPYHFVVFNEHAGYQAIAKQKDKRIKGIIVVAKDARISQLEQLQDNVIAFPAPAAFAASILTRTELSARGVAFQPRYVSSHDSVYLNVAKGFAAAGGGVMRTFNNTDAAVRDQLRVLWTSEGFTPHAFAAKSTVPESTKARLLAALLSLNDSDQGKALLQAVNFNGISPATNEDWSDVKSLGIDTLIGIKH